MTKANRIKAERKKILAILDGAGEKDLKMAMPLIENCAFMKVELEDLRESINENGTIDYYQNGATQKGTKASAELQAYLATMKQYTATMDKLMKMVPIPPDPKEDIVTYLRNLKYGEDEETEEGEMNNENK